MADVTISALTPGAPAGNDILPYGTGNNTLGTAVSALFQLASHKLGIGTGNTSLTDLSKLEVVGCGDVVSSSFNVRSWARFKTDNTTTNHAIMFDTGAPASSVSVRGLVFSYQNTAMGVARFDANKTLGYTTDVTISSGGNVHIGGAGLAYNPVHRLEVDGTIKATGLQVPGCIIQVVQAYKTDIWNASTGTGWEDVPGLSVSITLKSATSKVLINASVAASKGGGGSDAVVRIMRVTGSTSVAVGGGANPGSTFDNAFGQVAGQYSGLFQSYSLNTMYLDTPAGTTSTYKIQFYNGGAGAAKVNCRALYDDFIVASHITLQEIAQ